MVFKRFYLFLLIIGFLFIPDPGACSENAGDSHFYFVQITDTHFGEHDHLGRTKTAVKMINMLPMEIKCVVHTGDITMDKILDKDVLAPALTEMKKISVPVHYVPGNHDILMEKPDSTGRVYTDNFGSLISKAEYEGVIFLFVYTEPLRKKFTLKDYRPFEQLEGFLIKSDGKPVILFHHAPSVDDFYNNKMHPGWKKEIRDKWTALLNEHNVKAVIAGHFHRDEHHWLGNVPLYVSAPVAGYWKRQATFRIYEYRDGKVGYRTQYVE